MIAIGSVEPFLSRRLNFNAIEMTWASVRRGRADQLFEWEPLPWQEQRFAVSETYTS